MKLFCSWCRISLSGIDHVSVNPGSILNHQPFSFEPNVSPIQSLTGPVLATNSMAMENHLSRGKAGSQTGFGRGQFQKCSAGSWQETLGSTLCFQRWAFWQCNSCPWSSEHWAFCSFVNEEYLHIQNKNYSVTSIIIPISKTAYKNCQWKLLWCITQTESPTCNSGTCGSSSAAAESLAGVLTLLRTSKK